MITCIDVILTKHRFQCDVGASPTTGFAIGSNGVTYNGSGKFYACPVNDKGEYNVYTTPAPGQDKCVEISLGSAGSCGASPPKSSMPAPPPPMSMPAPPPMSMPPAPPSPSVCKPTTVTLTVTMTKPASMMPPAPTPMPPAPAPMPSKSMPAPAPPAPSMPAPKPMPMPPAGACPADLNGDYQYPHLIVPVDSSMPNKAYGTSYNGKVDKTTCSIFNFDIPSSYSGKKCSVVFLFPKQQDLTTSSFTTSGSGQCSFSKLSSPADQMTTYANQPSKAGDLGSMSIAPGNSYTIASGDCAAGQRISYEMCSSGDYALNYFQDYNPSPIGMYVRSC